MQELRKGPEASGNKERRALAAACRERQAEVRRLQGLELSREFYIQHAAPAISERFGERPCRVAAGLAGRDPTVSAMTMRSRDHDFGPGCCLWLTDDDFAKFGFELQALRLLGQNLWAFPAMRLHRARTVWVSSR